MVTNTLIGTDDGLGDTVDVFVFDDHLARSFLLVSSVTLAGCLAGVGASVLHLLGTGAIASTAGLIVLVVVSVIASWGVLVAATRLRRSDHSFVLHRFGLAEHHDGVVTRRRWVDIATVTHSGSNTGSKLARWAGSDYACRIDLRDGTTSTFDNYVVNAAVLGREIERRSLL